VEARERKKKEKKKRKVERVAIATARWLDMPDKII
jgi:hypothetical protein